MMLIFVTTTGVMILFLVYVFISMTSNILQMISVEQVYGNRSNVWTAPNHTSFDIDADNTTYMTVNYLYGMGLGNQMMSSKSVCSFHLEIVKTNLV